MADEDPFPVIGGDTEERDPMMSDDLAERYGRPARPGRRRLFIGAAVTALLIALAWAAWFSLTTGNPAVTWQNIGYESTDDGVKVTFEVTFTPEAEPSDAAVCTVEALNDVRTVIGSRDVRVGPVGKAGLRTFRISADVRTSEPVNAGLVQACAITS